MPIVTPKSGKSGCPVALGRDDGFDFGLGQLLADSIGVIAEYGDDLGTALAPILSTFVQQVFDVRAKEFELEVTALPTTGLTDGGSLAYTDTRLLNILVSFLAAFGGEYVPSVRLKWTGSAFVSYDTQPVFGEAFVNLRMDMLYRS